MYIKSARNVDVEEVLNMATLMVLGGCEEEYERREYDYYLGEVVDYSTREERETYEMVGVADELHKVDADFVDIAHIEALGRLQKYIKFEYWFKGVGNDGRN